MCEKWMVNDLVVVSTKAKRHVVVILVYKPPMVFIVNDVYYAVVYIKAKH